MPEEQEVAAVHGAWLACRDFFSQDRYWATQSAPDAPLTIAEAETVPAAERLQVRPCSRIPVVMQIQERALHHSLGSVWMKRQQPQQMSDAKQSGGPQPSVLSPAGGGLSLDALAEVQEKAYEYYVAVKTLYNLDRLSERVIQLHCTGRNRFGSKYEAALPEIGCVVKKEALRNFRKYKFDNERRQETMITYLNGKYENTTIGLFLPKRADQPLKLKCTIQHKAGAPAPDTQPQYIQVEVFAMEWQQREDARAQALTACQTAADVFREQWKVWRESLSQEEKKDLDEQSFLSPGTPEDVLTRLQQEVHSIANAPYYDIDKRCDVYLWTKAIMTGAIE